MRAGGMELGALTPAAVAPPVVRFALGSGQNHRPLATGTMPPCGLATPSAAKAALLVALVAALLFAAGFAAVVAFG